MLHRYVRRLNGALAIGWASRAAGAALFAAALWILATRRFATPALPWTPFVLGTLAVAAAGTAAVKTLRSAYRADEAAAYADWRAGTGGLLLTLRERPDERWAPALDARLADSSLPRVRWKPPLSRVLPGLLFLAAVLCVPVRAPAWRRSLAAAGESAAEQAKRRVDLLAEQKLLAAEEEKLMREEIGRIQEDLQKGAFGAGEWESLDALRRQLDQRLARTLGKMAEGTRALSAARREAAQNPKEWSLDEKTEAQKDLERALLEMGDAGVFRQMPPGMDGGELQSLLDRLGNDPAFNPAGDPERFRRLLGELRGVLKERGERLSSLWKLEGDLDGFLDGLSEDGDEEADGMFSVPGRGGVDRGRGDAPMSYGQEPSAQQGKFKDGALEGKFTELKPGELLALEKIDPETKPEEGAERGAARSFSGTEQEATWKRTIPARHRGVVRRYFTPEGKEAK